MAGWGSDLGGTGICPETAVLEEDRGHGIVNEVDANCRLPIGHDADHYDPALDLSWPVASEEVSHG